MWQGHHDYAWQQISTIFAEYCGKFELDVLYLGAERHGAYEWRAVQPAQRDYASLNRHVVLAAVPDQNGVVLTGAIGADDGRAFTKHHTMHLELSEAYSLIEPVGSMIERLVDQVRTIQPQDLDRFFSPRRPQSPDAARIDDRA